MEPTSRPLLAVNNTSLVVDGTIQLSIAVGKRKMSATFYVTPNVDEFILGRDWLTDHGVIWDFSEETIRINGETFPLKGHHRSTPTCKRAVTRAEVTIPPRPEAILPSYIIYSRLDNRDAAPSHWTTTLNSPVNGLRVARTLVSNETGSIGVRVCNTTERPICLHRGCTVSPLQPVSTLSTAQPDSEATPNASPDHVAPIIDRVDSSVPTATKERLRNLLTNYEDVFSRDEYDLGSTNIVQHHIDTGDNRPFRQPLRPQPRAQLPVIDRLLDEMQQQGVIQPCQSEWASNIVLVKKKDGSIRFCVDYRKLNSLTTKDAYPLPRVDICLNTLSGAAWYSTFDLRSGFHQVAMDPRDANKTTFVCHRGTYRFPKMPFGLCNAPATFQRLMDTVLSGLNYEVCLAYLDDIIVFSHDLDTHLQRLELLFTRLREAHLKLKPSKCQVLQKQVSFLGFNVSSQGVSTDPAKIAAIRDWPTPKNLRQSRAFVGLCQYYRRFVSGFSEIAAPLHALTKKGARFEWTNECQQAFDQLKHALSTAPVLALPDNEGELILDCDASGYAIGAVLSQVQNGEERPLCFASQLYNKHEKNYNVTRKELLAVITFVKKFRQYLLGQPFKIRTDHAALQWLKRTPEPIGQQARWLEILEEYDYTIVHRPGRHHGNADALSRREDPGEEEPTVVAAIVQPPEAANSWPAAQEADPDIQPVYDVVKSGSTPPSEDETTAFSAETKTLLTQLPQLHLDNSNILYRDWQHRDQHFRQIVVPAASRRDIADQLHRGLNGGHLGLRRAERQLQKRYYWPGWRHEVRQAQRRCEACARYKKPQNPRQGQLQPMVVGEPWERIGIDITGPHLTSARGNSYILTVIDHFSKWVELFPIRNQEASTVAKILVDRIICQHGCPIQILTDQGPNFESDLFRELNRMLDIDKVRTSAYKPSTNGNIERFHSTLHAMMAKLVDSKHRHWDEWLPHIAFAYRTSVPETTGYTPFFLTYGREARIPADLVYGAPPDEDQRAEPLHDFVDEQRFRLRESYSIARQELKRHAERRKRDYDLRVRPRHFTVGSMVWCLDPRRRTGRYKKWQAPYCGPFQITRQLGPVTYEIQKGPRTRPKVVHADKLKECVVQSREDQPPPAIDPPISQPERPRRTIRRPRRFLND